MASSNESTKLQLESWQPNSVCYLTPTVIFRVGVAPIRLDDMRATVEQRIDCQEDGIILWSEVMDPFQPVPEEKIAKATEQMLALELWQNWLGKGYIRQLPDPDNPMQLQFLVVCDPGVTLAKDKLVAWLGDLAKLLKSTVAGQRAICTISLLLLGEQDVDAVMVNDYLPRFRLGKVAWGGMQVNDAQAMQICQNTVVALLTSRFADCLESVLGNNWKSVAWIHPGAAAILVDIPTSRLRFETEVLGLFTKQLVCPPLDDGQREVLDSVADAKYREVQGEMLEEASRSAHDCGWEFKNEEPDEKGVWPEPKVLRDKQAHQGCYLTYDAEPARRIFGDSRFWWLDEREDELNYGSSASFFERIWKWVKFQWRQFLGLFLRIRLPRVEEAEEVLDKNYQLLYKRMNEAVRQYMFSNLLHADKEAWVGGYQKILDTFQFLLERKGYTEKLPMDPNVDWPSGTQAVHYIIGEMGDRLNFSPLFAYEGKQAEPTPLTSEQHWSMAAQADAAVIMDGRQRADRMRRGGFSLWGTLIRLVILLPMIFGLLLLALTGPIQAIIGLLAIAILVALALVDFLTWRFRYLALLKQVRTRINAMLAARVMSMLARIVQDQCMRVSALLPPMRAVFSDLIKALDEENERVMKTCADLAEQPGSREEASLYWMMDYKRILGTQSLQIKKYDEKDRERGGESKNMAEYKWPALAGETAFVYPEPETAALELSWKSEAKRLANAEASQASGGRYEKAETAFLVQQAMPLFYKAKLAPTIIKELREFSKKYAGQEFIPNLLAGYTLAEKFPALEKGRKWGWLYQRADPLSKDYKEHALLTFITVPGQEALLTAAGQASPYWPKEAVVVRSRQVNELGCLRAVVEWKKKE